MVCDWILGLKSDFYANLNDYEWKSRTNKRDRASK